MIRILVTFAIASEFAPWRRTSHFDVVDLSNPKTYLKRTQHAEIYAVMTGVGAPSVQTVFRRLVSKPVDICIAAGLAGSLRKEHSAGVVLAAKKVRAAGPDRVVGSDKSLFEIAGDCGARPVDCFWTSDTIVKTADEKSRLGLLADAVDMESLHVVQEAERLGIPAIPVRAVSDDANTNMPIDFNRAIDGRGQIAWAPALLELAKAPQRVPGLIRFGVESTRARRNLTQFLERYTTVLANERHIQLSTLRAELT